MHTAAMSNCKSFFDAYTNSIASEKKVKILDIGSQDVNGSLRSLVPPNFEYIGVDFVAGNGVDVILKDPYVLPFDSESVDVVLSSSCFEHSEMFWIIFLEILRILKPRGLFYLNVPSNGIFHRYPVDCWRFYPDSGRALVTWAKRNSINAVMLESYTSQQIATSHQVGDFWNDYVAVFLKDEKYINDFNDRILDTKVDVNNGILHGSTDYINPAEYPEDLRKLGLISQVVANRIKVG